jgi:hypothetical protein
MVFGYHVFKKNCRSNSESLKVTIPIGTCCSVCLLPRVIPIYLTEKFFLSKFDTQKKLFAPWY